MTMTEPTPEERAVLVEIVRDACSQVTKTETANRAADAILAAGYRLQRPGEGVDRAQVERIVYHAMSSASMSRVTLEDLKAAPPSVDGNYMLLYLSNAVDEIMALSPAPAGEKEAVEESEIPNLLERARRGEALTAREQSAWTGYELGWRDGHNTLTAERDAALAEAGRMRGAWDWLAAHPGMELSWGDDQYQTEGEAVWRVHRRSGSINDREWALIAEGETPLAVVQAALTHEADHAG